VFKKDWLSAKKGHKSLALDKDNIYTFETKKKDQGTR
jgi:hypothetical protein